MQRIVNQALKRYSEDRIGMVDYALESGGACDSPRFGRAEIPVPAGPLASARAAVVLGLGLEISTLSLTAKASEEAWRSLGEENTVVGQGEADSRVLCSWIELSNRRGPGHVPAILSTWQQPSPPGALGWRDALASGSPTPAPHCWGPALGAHTALLSCLRGECHQHPLF